MASNRYVPFFSYFSSSLRLTVNAITKMWQCTFERWDRCCKTLCINSFRLLQLCKSHQMHAEFHIHSISVCLIPPRNLWRTNKIISESWSTYSGAAWIRQISCDLGTFNHCGAFFIYRSLITVIFSVRLFHFLYSRHQHTIPFQVGGTNKMIKYFWNEEWVHFVWGILRVDTYIDILAAKSPIVQRHGPANAKREVKINVPIENALFCDSRRVQQPTRYVCICIVYGYGHGVCQHRSWKSSWQKWIDDDDTHVSR